MATSGPKAISWPFEYRGWRCTFHVYPAESALTNWPVVTRRPPKKFNEPVFASPTIEHLHDDPQQLVRWTKKRKPRFKTTTAAWVEELQDSKEEEQLCCFVCAVYMPQAVYDYFEKCKEMTKCIS